MKTIYNMKTVTIAISLFIITAFPFNGLSQTQQTINQQTLFQPTEPNDPDDSDTSLIDNVSNIDSLLSRWYTQRSPEDTVGIILLEGEDLPPALLPDSVYISRLSSIASPISLPYNEIIRNNIVYYTQKKPRSTEEILGRGEYYMPRFEEVLDMYDLPLEFKVLPLIESAFRATAVSRMKATGMWQFIFPTGRQYNLAINSYVDERLDPIASAHAAAKYLRDMYKIFGDWTLAIAAYNCGSNNVRKAIIRANGKTDFWDIYPYLPRETRGYVPSFIAATYVVNYYREHKLTPKPVSLPISIDTFMINRDLHFGQIASSINIPIEQLQELNPQYRRNIIPGKTRPYELRIPFEYTNAYIQNEKAMYGKDSLYFNGKKVVAIPAEKTPGKYTASTEGKKKIVHKVAKGEVVGSIAEKYGVKASDVQDWNNLNRKSFVKEGQKLVIYTNSTDNNTPVSTATAATTQKNETANNAAATAKKTTTPQAATTAKTVAATHKVKKGENLWGIAQQYDNVSYADLLTINGLTKDSKLQIGQIIKLK